MFSCPLRAAAYRAVQPLCAAAFTSAAFERSSRTASSLPWLGVGIGLGLGLEVVRRRHDAHLVRARVRVRVRVPGVRPR